MNAARQALADGWFPVTTIERLGSGHIHDTWLATDPQGRRFVLQRLNSEVFKDPAAVMKNVARIVDHVWEQEPGLVPRLIPATTGQRAHRDAEGNLWRLWDYVADTRVLSEVDEAGAEAAGAAFGRLQSILATLPAPALVPVIPGFLELDTYLQAFDALPPAVKRSVQPEWNFIDARRTMATQLRSDGDYIHGDCKLDNLLFDNDGCKVRCIVDLDTVMRGHWAWDFGDLVRSVLRHSRVDQFEALFAALCRGFLVASGRRAQARELIAAPGYVTLMLGVRRLTDHLQGDRYFKVSQPGENLEQARGQFKLLETIESRSGSLTAAIIGIDGVS